MMMSQQGPKRREDKKDRNAYQQGLDIEPVDEDIRSCSTANAVCQPEERDGEID